MPGSKESAVASRSDLNEEAVRRYLQDHGDFLQRNPDILDFLHIPHASGGAVSLVEKQVSVLRERNVEMRHRLNTLTDNARNNDNLYEQTRALVLGLLEAGNVGKVYDTFMHSMREDFGVEHASMVLFGDPSQAPPGCRVEHLADARERVGGLLKSHKPVCGVLRKEELAWLFPDARGVGSAAVAPLYRAEEQGLIAVGSSDPDYYGSALGTLFLDHIAAVMVRLLPRLRGGGA